MEHQQQTATSQSKRKDESDETRQQDNGEIADDIDHALGESLRAISLRTGKRPNAHDEDDLRKNPKMVQIEWNEELEEMSREKASAESRSGGILFLHASKPF
jgi:hypothetical protein